MIKYEQIKVTKKFKYLGEGLEKLLKIERRIMMGIYGPKKTDKRPRNRNKNRKTKILLASGKNGPRESLTESVNTRA